MRIHYREAYNEWREIDLEVKPQEGSSLDLFDVVHDGEKIGCIWRLKDHRTHQVHRRIRYDNKPRTRFKRFDKTNGLTRDTRLEVIGEILRSRFRDVHEVDEGLVHQAGKPGWRSCGLCDHETEKA